MAAGGLTQGGLCRRRAAAACLLSLAASLGLYVRTAAPTIYALDSSGLTRAAATLTPAHPPGYPLYVLLGRLFIWALPWGDAGYRLNLMSAVFGAVAVAIVCHLLTRLGASPIVAATAALSLAASFYFWSISVMAEVYTLNCVVAACIVGVALRWRDLRDRRLLWVLGGLVGLGLGNHVSIALLLPGVVWLVGRTDGRVLRQAGTMAGSALAFGAGLGVYALLPLRQRFDSLPELARFVMAHQFWASVFAYSPPAYVHEVLVYVRDLWASFLGIGLLLGLVGLAAMWRRDRDLAVAIALMLGANVAFFSGYRVADKALMVGHTYLLWTLWLGIGLQAALDRMSSVLERRPGWPVAETALPSLAVLALIVVNWPHADLSHDWRVRQRAEKILAGVGPGALVVVRSWADREPLRYLQAVESRRPDVTVLDAQSPRAAATAASLVEASIDRRPVYSLERAADFGAIYDEELDPACDCYQWRRSDR